MARLFSPLKKRYPLGFTLVEVTLALGLLSFTLLGLLVLSLSVFNSIESQRLKIEAHRWSAVLESQLQTQDFATTYQSLSQGETASWIAYTMASLDPPHPQRRVIALLEESKFSVDRLSTKERLIDPAWRIAVQAQTELPENMLAYPDAWLELEIRLYPLKALKGSPDRELTAQPLWTSLVTLTR